MRLPQKHCYAHSLLLQRTTNERAIFLSALIKVVSVFFLFRLLLKKQLRVVFLTTKRQHVHVSTNRPTELLL